MARFDPIPDFGAPLAVTAVDLVVETTMPQWNNWAAYLCAGGGYLGAWMGWGGEFTKNFGIAALPWAAKKLYYQFMGGTSRKVSFRPPSPAGSKVGWRPLAV